MQITLGFSPCPNDTFIFDAIVNKRIDLEGLEFEIILADVEKLNQLADILIEKEVIFKDDLEAIFGKRSFDANLEEVVS